MRKNALIALVIALLIALWLISGLFNQEQSQNNTSSLVEQREQARLQQMDQAPVPVRALEIQSEIRQRLVTLRGKTANKRTVTVKSETPGRIVERPVERGDRVEAGDLICKLALDDRAATVEEAKSALSQAKIDFEGAKKLEKRGLQSETATARAAADLERARANLLRAEINLEHMQITAPFAGVIEDLHVDTGDFLGVGDPCATLMDLDPMLVTAQATELQAGQIVLGSQARMRLSTGEEITGEITFVGFQSSDQTRTYSVEVTVPNTDYHLRSGLTARLKIPVGQVAAHRISPALFSLDDQGEIGIKIIGADNRVAFYLVQILEDDPDGIWVTGLPNNATLITVGQELVETGQRVDPSFDSNPVAGAPGT